MPVEDPSAYGLVRSTRESHVLEFIEKPRAPDVGVNTVSAGAYVLERAAVMDLLEPGRPASIERDVFPRMVGNGLHGHVTEGYWVDIGTPERYLQGDLRHPRGAHRDARRAPGGVVGGPVDGEVRAPAVIGAGATVGAGSVVERAVVLDGARVGDRLRAARLHRGPGRRRRRTAPSPIPAPSSPER